MAVWSWRDDWASAHTCADLGYSVLVAVEPSAAADAIWARLKQVHRTDGEAILVGGAAILREGTDRFEVISGGEDALDSLDHALNDVLADAIEAASTARATVVAEERQLLP